MTRSTSTVERRLACAVEDLEPGTSMILPGDDPIAVHRTEGGEFFATADSCTHEKWSLGEDSELEGDEVVCPLHLARFDLRTGKPLCLPATLALRTYPVETEAGKVYVRV